MCKFPYSVNILNAAEASRSKVSFVQVNGYYYITMIDLSAVDNAHCLDHVSVHLFESKRDFPRKIRRETKRFFF